MARDQKKVDFEYRRGQSCSCDKFRIKARRPSDVSVLRAQVLIRETRGTSGRWIPGGRRHQRAADTARSARQTQTLDSTRKVRPGPLISRCCTDSQNARQLCVHERTKRAGLTPMYHGSRPRALSTAWRRYGMSQAMIRWSMRLGQPYKYDTPQSLTAHLTAESPRHKKQLVPTLIAGWV